MTEIVTVFLIVEAKDGSGRTSIKEQSNSTFGGRVAHARRRGVRALILGRDLRKPPKSAVSTIYNLDASGVIVCFIDANTDSVFGEEVGDGFAPFDDDDVGGVFEILAEVVGHEAGVGETIKVVVDEAAVRMR